MKRSRMILGAFVLTVGAGTVSAQVPTAVLQDNGLSDNSFADGWLYATVDWRSSDGNTSGDALIRVRVPVPPCIGDINGDGDTDLTDLSILLAHFGANVPVGTNGDLNSDGSVTLTDLSILLANFGCMG